jgi:hypothetical protein
MCTVLGTPICDTCGKFCARGELPLGLVFDHGHRHARTPASLTSKTSLNLSLSRGLGLQSDLLPTMGGGRTVPRRLSA